MGSLFFLFFLFFRFYLNNFSIFIFLRLLIKIGFFPFYFWISINILLLNWESLLLFSSIIKIPLIFLFLELVILKFSKLIEVILILNVFLISLYATYQTYFKLIVTYSSLSHIRWVLFINMKRKDIALTYFLIYLLELLLLLIVIIGIEKSLIRNFNVKFRFSFLITLVIHLIILSLAGIPPFIGFIKKIIGLLTLVNIRISLSCLLVLRRIVRLFFYFICFLNNIISIFSYIKKENGLVLYYLFLFMSFLFINLFC